MSQRKNEKLDAFCKVLAESDKAYGAIPQKAKMEIEKVARTLLDIGSRKLGIAGSGMELLDMRKYERGKDDWRKIHFKRSAKLKDEYVVVVREKEVPHQIFIHCGSSKSTHFTSMGPESNSVLTTMQIIAIGLAKYLAKQYEAIGMMNNKGVYRGNRAGEMIGQQLVTIIAGDTPTTGRKFPPNSTIVMFNDFLIPLEEVKQTLNNMSGAGLKGFLVMTLDPQVLNFDFKGDIDFMSMEDEGSIQFSDIEKVREEYLQAMHDHIEGIKKLCKAKGFKFILHTTNDPYYKPILALLGLTPGTPSHRAALAP